MFHSYPERSYRNPDTQEDEWTQIVVIFCPIAKARGAQRYKRILPNFLIPYARIRLDAVLQTVRKREASTLTTGDACHIMGCRESRTAWMHMKRIEEAARAVALSLAEHLAMEVHLHSCDQQLQPAEPIERLTQLHRQEKDVLARAGKSDWKMASIGEMLQAVVWKRFKKPSISYVSRPPPSPCYTS